MVNDEVTFEEEVYASRCVHVRPFCSRLLFYISREKGLKVHTQAHPGKGNPIREACLWAQAAEEEEGAEGDGRPLEAKGGD